MIRPRSPHSEQLKRNRFLMSPRPHKTTSYVKTARFVRGIRKSLGMSQPEFADAYGFNLRTLQGWESGRFRPSVDALAKLESIKS